MPNHPRITNSDDSPVSLAALAERGIAYAKKRKMTYVEEWSLFDVQMEINGIILTIPLVRMKMDKRDYTGYDDRPYQRSPKGRPRSGGKI